MIDQSSQSVSNWMARIINPSNSTWDSEHKHQLCINRLWANSALIFSPFIDSQQPSNQLHCNPGLKDHSVILRIVWPFTCQQVTVSIILRFENFYARVYPSFHMDMLIIKIQFLNTIRWPHNNAITLDSHQKVIKQLITCAYTTHHRLHSILSLFQQLFPLVAVFCYQIQSSFQFFSQSTLNSTTALDDREIALLLRWLISIHRRITAYF